MGEPVNMPSCLAELNRPFHALINDQRFRQRSELIITHGWNDFLFKGDIFPIGGDFYVCSPELCFLQMASIVSTIKLIEIGFEICGLYALSGNTLTQRKPLTSVKRLTAYIKKHKGTRGVKKALRVLAHIIDRSASPMETKLCILLILPYRMGGYGFVNPLMNASIEKSGREGSTLGDHFVADLMWPGKQVILEYDSTLHHAGVEKQICDSIRRAELTELGYSVTSVTYPHLATAMGTNNLAILFAAQLNRRLQIPEPAFSEARDKLRKELFASQRLRPSHIN